MTCGCTVEISPVLSFEKDFVFDGADCPDHGYSVVMGKICE